MAGRSETGSLLVEPMPQSHPDQSDFMRLFVRHERDLRVFARTLLPNWPAVDDVLQEASVVMWRKAASVGKGGGFLSPGHGSLFASRP